MARPPTRSRRGLTDATLPRGLAADTPPRARAVSREPYLELPRVPFFWPETARGRSRDRWFASVLNHYFQGQTHKKFASGGAVGHCPKDLFRRFCSRTALVLN